MSDPSPGFAIDQLWWRDGVDDDLYYVLAPNLPDEGEGVKLVSLTGEHACVSEARLVGAVRTHEELRGLLGVERAKQLAVARQLIAIRGYAPDGWFDEVKKPGTMPGDTPMPQVADRVAKDVRAELDRLGAGRPDTLSLEDLFKRHD